MARRTHTESWWEKASPTVLRCTAHYKSDGSQCRTEAAAGTNVCDKHGALIPAVRAAAATRIQLSVDEASERLVELMRDKAVDVRERIKIMHDLLDRGGLGATSKLLVGVVADDPVETLFRDLLSREGALVDPTTATGPKEIQADATDWDALSDDEFVEAELVEEEPVHTIHVRESMSSAPPKHLRTDLERAAQLRSLL